MRPSNLLSGHIAKLQNVGDKKIRHDMLEISAPREDFLVFIATNIHIVALNIAVG